MNTTIDGYDLAQLKGGDRILLKDLYKKFRTPFIKWAVRQYPRYADDVPDVYQRAFTIFYFNVKEGKFTGQDSTIPTYLYGIGKNLLNKMAGNKHEQTESLDSIKEIVLSPENTFDKFEISHRQQLVRSILEKVGEPCKTILTKYYYDNFSMEAIAENLGYKTSMVAKKKKCECLIKIRKALKDTVSLTQPKE